MDLDAEYVVNLSFANIGTQSAPDTWVSATLPSGTQFITSTYIGGLPRPPDTIEGTVLTWAITPLWAHSTWGHILVTLQTDDHLPEGADLPFAAGIASVPLISTCRTIRPS